jgi:Holliday junction resolvasome RuvABC endonuclease subunit
MRVMAIDPGAKRCGWAVLDKGPVWEASGIFSVIRMDNEKYQPYRIRLIQSWTEWSEELFDKYQPDELVAEIVPVVGGGNFVVATQSQLASTVSIVLMTVAFQKQIKVTQISANRVKKQIGREKDASKPKVRNGVYKVLPRFKEAYQGSKQGGKEYNKVGVWDEIDAVAIGLTHMGYTPLDDILDERLQP